MRDDDFRRSTNIEDRRGDDDSDYSSNSGGFGGGGIPIIPSGGGIIGIIITIILFFIFGGGHSNRGLSSNGYQQSQSASNSGYQQTASEAKLKDHVAAVLGSTEDYWTDFFKSQGGTYTDPTLVIFNNSTSSPCGKASQATGPFYCPTDKKIYLDMGFFKEMDQSLGARGDFAQAYVIAHEVGHHVQDELGILSKANKLMARSGQNKGADSLSVRLELQADCFAGAWAKNGVENKGALDQGDVEEAINAAQAVGDDRLQKRAQGYAVPDSFTHGTSEQRAKWFMTGMNSGDPAKCNTFSAKTL